MIRFARILRALADRIDPPAKVMLIPSVWKTDSGVLDAREIARAVAAQIAQTKARK